VGHLEVVAFVHIVDQAVDDLSFEVQPGRVTGFPGPNGAGKPNPGK
jgi:ABC-type multidrug transport system ATPase subunit